VTVFHLGLGQAGQAFMWYSVSGLGHEGDLMYSSPPKGDRSWKTVTTHVMSCQLFVLQGCLCSVGNAKVTFFYIHKLLHRTSEFTDWTNRQILSVPDISRTVSINWPTVLTSWFVTSVIRIDWLCNTSHVYYVFDSAITVSPKFNGLCVLFNRCVTWWLNKIAGQGTQLVTKNSNHSCLCSLLTSILIYIPNLEFNPYPSNVVNIVTS
jgi:hypothetical protein